MSNNRNEELNISSSKIDKLESDEIFVFGSNLEGNHLGGAAKAAYKKFGAVWGVGVGLQGNSYAIPTMHGGANAIKPYVDQFLDFAKSRKDLKFLVTRIGCGIAGFKEEEIAPLFYSAYYLDNVYLPIEFRCQIATLKAKQVIAYEKNLDVVKRALALNAKVCDMHHEDYSMYETFWIMEMHKVHVDNEQHHTRYNLEHYIFHGLENFCKSDGVPMSMKAILLNRYMHWGGYSIEDFKDWYKGQNYKMTV